jgi:hypothetical protein
MTTPWLIPQLLALPRGSRVRPKEAFTDEPNYIFRADSRHALRQRLANLSKQGKFRMIGNDEWERA